MSVLPDTEPFNAGQQQEPGHWENTAMMAVLRVKAGASFKLDCTIRGFALAVWNPEQLQCKGFTVGCPRKWAPNTYPDFKFTLLVSKPPSSTQASFSVPNPAITGDKADRFLVLPDLLLYIYLVKAWLFETIHQNRQELLQSEHTEG